MASAMGICGGLVGPKAENVDFSLVLVVFLKRGGRRAQFRSGQNGLDLGRFGVEKGEVFYQSCFVAIFENMLATAAGSIFLENS